MPIVISASKRLSEPSARLVRKLVKAAHDSSKFNPPPFWASVDQVVKQIGGGVTEEIDAAIAYAVAHQWLRTDGGQPPLSVCVTPMGMEMLKRR